MNIKKIKNYSIFSTIFVIVIGALLHFTFKWSNYNPLIGAFSAVNESVWEHLKILFFPMLLTTIIGYFYLDKPDNYICNKTKGILLAFAFIIVFFYTYSGIIGTHYPIIDIISFIIAVIIGETYSYKNIKLNNTCNNKLAIITLLTLTISFIIFTFNTPHLGIFKDLSTNTYGIKK